MTFGFHVDSRNFCGPEKFLFYTGRIVTTELPNLVPQQRIDDCCVIHFLHWELCDPRLSNHPNFPLWARLYQYVFCKKLLLFSSSSRCRNLGPSESACRHHAYPEPVPLLLAAPLVIHEKSWENILMQEILVEIQLPVQQVLQQFTSYCFVVFIFICVFSFCWSTRRVSPWLLTHNLTSFCCWIFRDDHSILRWRWWRSRCGRCRGTPVEEVVLATEPWSSFCGSSQCLLVGNVTWEVDEVEDECACDIMGDTWRWNHLFAKTTRSWANDTQLPKSVRACNICACVVHCKSRIEQDRERATNITNLNVSAPGHSTHCWAYTQCTGIRTHWLSSQQTTTPPARKSHTTEASTR